MTNDNDTLTASRQDEGKESDMPSIDIPLETELKGKVIHVTGAGEVEIPEGQKATIFKFILKDETGFNVKFDSLDVADNSETCPPPSGKKSKQIVADSIHNEDPPKMCWAQFTDNNSNDPKLGKLKISYQWNFTCDAGATVEPFDPIISNGGRTGG